MYSFKQERKKSQSEQSEIKRSCPETQIVVMNKDRKHTPSREPWKDLTFDGKCRNER